jgi:hypothetical protein
MSNLDELTNQLSSWPEVSVHPHRFGGREFRFRSAEIGHVHVGGIVDIPFPRSIRDELLKNGLAQNHHWVPNSGWITFHIQKSGDLNRALWLMRLSYLRYALKSANDPRNMFELESEQLHLSQSFKSLLEAFIPKISRPLSSESIPA